MNGKDFVAIDMQIIFSPDEAWTTLSEFEGELASFFMARGFEARKANVFGNQGRLVIVLSKKLSLAPPPPPKEEGPVVDILNKVRNLKPQPTIRNFNQYKK